MNSSNLQFEILLPGASGLHRSPQRGGEYDSLELRFLTPGRCQAILEILGNGHSCRFDRPLEWKWGCCGLLTNAAPGAEPYSIDPGRANLAQCLN